MSESNPPVVAGVQGKAEAPVNDSKSESQVERTYTAADLEAIMRDRMIRADRSHQKELKKLQEQLQEAQKQREQKPSTNLEEDYKGKLSQHVAEKKALAEKLAKFQTEGLRSTVKAKLAMAGCVDPDDVSDLLIARKLVQLDDDGNLQVENVTNSLDDLVTDYSAKKPHHFRASSSGGLGTKGPVNPAVSSGQMTIADMEAALGITRKSNKLFGRK